MMQELAQSFDGLSFTQPSCRSDNCGERSRRCASQGIGQILRRFYPAKAKDSGEDRESLFLSCRKHLYKFGLPPFGKFMLQRISDGLDFLRIFQVNLRQYLQKQIFPILATENAHRRVQFPEIAFHGLLFADIEREIAAYN